MIDARPAPRGDSERGDIEQEEAGVPGDRSGSPALRADELLEVLADAAALADPVPEPVLGAARAALGWRTLDADLAALVEDTSERPLAGVRGDGPRLLTFEADDTAVVVEVRAVGSARRLLGQLVEPRAARIEVRHPGGTTSVDADDLGRFAAAEIPAGPVSIVCRFGPPSARVVATTWVTL
ncbi:MAG TPA: hypothetical protein VFS29_02975 [Motilibacteraceae bacterium]|nr:hypothetical protein [Motilibacteraceae bacterium]